MSTFIKCKIKIMYNKIIIKLTATFSSSSIICYQIAQTLIFCKNFKLIINIYSKINLITSLTMIFSSTYALIT